MITNDIITLFEGFASTLKDRSWDDANDVHMTSSTRPAIDFDAFKIHYVHNRDLTSTPRSCDALFLCKNNALHFIEFRNARSKRNNKEFQIKEKIYDSILMFLDATQTKLSDMAEHINVIVVYNESLNTHTNLEDVPEVDTLGNSIARHGGRTIPKFKLSSFEKYCFKSVQTLTPHEFDRLLQTL